MRLSTVVREGVRGRGYRAAARATHVATSTLHYRLKQGVLPLDELPALLGQMDVRVRLQVASELCELVPLPLDGPATDPHHAVAILRTAEESEEARQAYTIVQRLGCRAELNDAERDELRKALLQQFDVVSAQVHLIRCLCERHAISTRELAAEHRRKVRALGYAS